MIIEEMKELLMVVVVIVGLVLIFAVYFGLAALKDWVTSWREYRAILTRIWKLTPSAARATLKVPKSGVVRVDKAVRDHLVKLSSVKGHDLEKVKVSLEPMKPRASHKISFPLGLVFRSDGSHQNMSVRETRVQTVKEPVECDIPVTCINFHMSVPGSSDSFVSFDKVSAPVQKILAVAGAADVSAFVTQLATWIVTDNVHPSRVSIGRRFDLNRRTATKWETLLAQAIVEKSRELTFS